MTGDRKDSDPCIQAEPSGGRHVPEASCVASYSSVQGRRPGVFLDRDGVINDQTDHVNAPAGFRLLPGVAKAIRRLNEAELPVIVVTNQGGIAFGYLTEEDLAAIHRYMADLLAAEGSHVDAVYYCPHFPDGDTGGRMLSEAVARYSAQQGKDTSRYFADCPDRKPGVGMFERARGEWGIDLRRSFLVGDSWTDIVAGQRAGCMTILVKTGHGGNDGPFRNVTAPGDMGGGQPNFVVADLPAAVDVILAELPQLPRFDCAPFWPLRIRGLPRPREP